MREIFLEYAKKGVMTKEEVRRLRERPKDWAAVYFLIRRNQVVYVGSTTCLGRRLVSHRRKISYDAAYFIPFKNVVDARNAEISFIQRIKPPLNKIRLDYYKDANGEKWLQCLF